LPCFINFLVSSFHGLCNNFYLLVSLSSSNPCFRCFIILGFKSLDKGVSSVLLRTWKDWTGARSIYLNLHSDFDLVKIVFYHSLSNTNSTFTYLVLVEMANVSTNNVVRLLDFVQRTRVERLTGFISLYRDLGSPGYVSQTREQHVSPQKRSGSSTSVDSSFSLSDYDSKLFSSCYDGHDSHSDSLEPAVAQKSYLSKTTGRKTSTEATTTSNPKSGEIVCQTKLVSTSH